MMKKLFIMILFFLIITDSWAPTGKVMFICRPEPITPFARIIYAIGMVECGNDTAAINDQEQAYGYFQIRKVRLVDYYKRTGIKYTLGDMLDYRKALGVFIFYARGHGAGNPERIARDWNGSGPKTTDYWNKVKRYYELYNK